MIRVRDAHEHNLAHLDLDVPRDRIVAFTGVSGSGKSSLAFGTIFAEAQRRFLESVSPYARRLMDQVPATSVGDITGLPPAIALRQSHGHGSARSSVGTVTNISNSLRMLFSRFGDYPEGAPRLDSNLFSPNTAEGGCPTCHGLGRVHDADADLMVPDHALSIRDGAIAAWPGAWHGKNLRDVVAGLGIDIDMPWRDLPADQREWLLFTDEEPTVTVSPIRAAHQIQREYQGTFTSARSHLMRTFASTKSATQRMRVAAFLRSRPCAACDGKRLRPEALAVRIAGLDISAASALSLAELADLLSGLGERDGARLVADVVDRVRALVDLGLGYLALDRAAPTLSAGELQRLRLGTQLRSGLFGVLYVLDEPSVGLHPSDTEMLIAAIRRLRESGNSVFVVEHNLDLVRAADWIVDIGPGAGVDGGHVLYSGPPTGLGDVAASATGRHLIGHPPLPRVGGALDEWLTVTGLTSRNLREPAVRLPLHALTAVTGPSGAGKSTLLDGVCALLGARFGVAAQAPADPVEADGDGDGVDDGGVDVSRASVIGAEGVDRLVRVDQEPIGRTSRSNLGTYTGLFDVVRKLFASTPTARERGYKAGRFSFNVAGGRCERCEGLGEISVGMLFLPDAVSRCPECAGARYEPQTLQVRYEGMTIADVLALSVVDARAAFDGVPAAVRTLDALLDIGLGHLTIGQPATTLSGGEAQRIKLATELQRVRGGHTVYVLDEPTSGLHPADIDDLAAILRRLVLGAAAGRTGSGRSTVLLAEHDMRVVASADWVLDLGPGGGDAGGRVVAAGTPADVAANPESVTGRYLAAYV